MGGITFWKLISQAFSPLYLSSSLLFPALLLSRTPPTERLEQATQLSARSLWKVGLEKGESRSMKLRVTVGSRFDQAVKVPIVLMVKSDESGNTYFWSSFLECPGSKGTYTIFTPCTTIDTCNPYFSCAAGKNKRKITTHDFVETIQSLFSNLFIIDDNQRERYLRLKRSFPRTS